ISCKLRDPYDYHVQNLSEKDLRELVFGTFTELMRYKILLNEEKNASNNLLLQQQQQHQQQ
ncbi:hypothetical protein DOY81_001509, partial [Sarcophaga bullata]